MGEEIYGNKRTGRIRFSGRNMQLSGNRCNYEPVSVFTDQAHSQTGGGTEFISV